MKKRKCLAGLVLAMMLILGYTIPAAATDGSFEVTFIVNGFDGATPLTNINVEMFGRTKNTDNHGACTFKLKNLPDSAGYPFSITDNTGAQFGFGTVTIDRADETGIMARPAGAAGQFGIQLYYNDFTSFFTIVSIIDQANVWSVDMLDFDEAYPDFASEPEPQQEPPHEEPMPEGEMIDPDMPHEEPPGDFFEEPRHENFDNETWWSRVDVLAASLAGGVLVLLILVIILLVKNSKQKKKETKKE